MTLISGEDRKEEPLTLCHISKQNMRYFFSLSLSLSLLFLSPSLWAGEIISALPATLCMGIQDVSLKPEDRFSLS